MSSKFLNILSLIKRKIKYKKSSYSFNAVDLIVDHMFKKKGVGFYLDIGSQNPISNNNTYLLFQRGWRGINIDLDIKNIELFKICRPNDINLNFAISSSISKKKLYFYHDKSPINTLSHEVANFQKAAIKEIKTVNSVTLNSVLENINFDNEISYMNIDVEGHEIDVLKGFDLKKYKPSVISVEYLDLKMKHLELRNNDLSRVIKSELYVLLIKNNYHLVNWLHGDLIFAHDSFRD